MNLNMNTLNNSSILWIAWEKQRRTIELSKSLNAELILILSSGGRLTKYWGLIYRTFMTILKKRPDVLIVQNPSVVLSALCSILKYFFGFTLVVDRHTNFKLHKRNSLNPLWLLFFCLSRLSLKHADITIVTNKYLKLMISNVTNGKVAILPDRIPTFYDMYPRTERLDKGSLTGMFICTFSEDEPYMTALNAFKGLPNIKFNVTGNYKKDVSATAFAEKGNNINLLGFVSDEEYIERLKECDFTIILTTQEFTLNCGSYESIALGKPMILSDTKTIRQYFDQGAVYANPLSSESIADSASKITENILQYRKEVISLNASKKSSWDQMYLNLKDMIADTQRSNR